MGESLSDSAPPIHTSPAQRRRRINPTGSLGDQPLAPSVVVADCTDRQFHDRQRHCLHLRQPGTDGPRGRHAQCGADGSDGAGASPLGTRQAQPPWPATARHDANRPAVWAAAGRFQTSLKVESAAKSADKSDWHPYAANEPAADASMAGEHFFLELKNL